ncbi:hypothetical protein BKA56DRAFT_345458 [Ilyonectria sp. MPI-CAGE-AT-0026]|nr:hypothetical protein BKA56DRAFT_345458 [Ilyonectria sp. MPI-CAGE-AT-0026]
MQSPLLHTPSITVTTLRCHGPPTHLNLQAPIDRSVPEPRAARTALSRRGPGEVPQGGSHPIQGGRPGDMRRKLLYRPGAAGWDAVDGCVGLLPRDWAVVLARCNYRHAICRCVFV